MNARLPPRPPVSDLPATIRRQPQLGEFDINTRPITPETMQRLAFIRLLAQQGMEQSRLPDPLAAGSILTFHDAVEFFLILASEHLGISVPDRGQFVARYYDNIHPDKAGPGGVDLAGRIGIRRLTDQRNSFKHTAALPVAGAITQARSDVTQFFEDNTPRVFGLPFDGINMTDLVPQPHTRHKLTEAESEDTKGNRTAAMAWLVEAFDELLAASTAPDHWRGTPFSFGPDLFHQLSEGHVARVLRQPPEQDRHMPVRGASTLAKEYVQLRESVVALQRGARLTALGIDYSEYWRFHALTPTVHRPFNSHSPRRIATPPGYAPDDEEFTFCLRFVISAALRIAEVMTHRRPPSWQG
ncbi:hypothetical protein [Streptomyces sp. NPDC005780]|uniref:hypothetical protein n=1 Tax=Streptomyces sp. NPDC005780 TaxID=3364730 RepID=UPI0036AC5728